MYEKGGTQRREDRSRYKGGKMQKKINLAGQVTETKIHNGIFEAMQKGEEKIFFRGYYEYWVDIPYTLMNDVRIEKSPVPKSWGALLKAYRYSVNGNIYAYCGEYLKLVKE